MADPNSYTSGLTLGQGVILGRLTESQTTMTAIDAAEQALDRARQLSIHIQSVADRILGPQPVSLNKASETEPTRSGVFPILQSSSERTQAIISEGFEAINRIERSLP